jgi:hypothetical protein
MEDGRMYRKEEARTLKKNSKKDMYLSWFVGLCKRGSVFFFSSSVEILAVEEKNVV